MKHTAAILSFLGLALVCHAEIRTWTDASGQHKIEAELVGVQAGKVTLKRANGTVITLTVNQLSAADQALLGGGRLRMAGRQRATGRSGAVRIVTMSPGKPDCSKNGLPAVRNARG
jgi:hypothetical protein